MVNMRDVSKAVGIYVLDYDGVLSLHPQTLGWMKPLSKLRPIDTGLINCSVYNPHSSPELGNGFGFNLTYAKYPAKKGASTAYLWDGWDLKTKPAPSGAGLRVPVWVDWRHMKGANIGFFDGHAKWHQKPTVHKSETVSPLLF